MSDVASTLWRYSFIREAPEHAYKEAVPLLLQFEGRRCLWRVAAGGACLLLFGVLAVAVVVGGTYLAADLERPPLVVLGAVIALSVPIVAGYVWRRPWARLVTDRLATYEWSDGAQDLNAVVRPEDFMPAFRALRRTKLNPVGGTHMPQGPPDAPDLTLKLIVGRSAYWHPDGSPDLFDQIRAALEVAGIRARVGREDINPDA